MTDWKEKVMSHWGLINRLAKRRFTNNVIAEEAALFVINGLEEKSWQRLENFNGKASLPADQWREQVEQGCAERQESVTFWREIEKKGRQLQARLEELNQSEKEILESLLPLMYEIEKKNVAERCRRVVDLLAEEWTNR